jgi:hypothetical protein
MTVQYGDNCMNHRKVYEWKIRSKRRWPGVDDERYGRATDCNMIEFKKQNYQRIRDNRRTRTAEIAPEMSISHGKKRWRNGLRPNKMHCIVTESGNLWSLRQNSLKSGASTYINNISRIFNCCVIVVSKLIIQLVLSFTYFHSAYQGISKSFRTESITK